MEFLGSGESPLGMASIRSPSSYNSRLDDVRVKGNHHVPRTAALSCTCKTVPVANQVLDH